MQDVEFGLGPYGSYGLGFSVFLEMLVGCRVEQIQGLRFTVWGLASSRSRAGFLEEHVPSGLWVAGWGLRV